MRAEALADLNDELKEWAARCLLIPITAHACVRRLQALRDKIRDAGLPPSYRVHAAQALPDVFSEATVVSVAELLREACSQ
jgi:hypothetical protein